MHLFLGLQAFGVNVCFLEQVSKEFTVVRNMRTDPLFGGIAVQQREKSSVLALGLELRGDLVSDKPTERPAKQEIGTARLDPAYLVKVIGCHFFKSGG